MDGWAFMVARRPFTQKKSTFASLVVARRAAAPHGVLARLYEMGRRIPVPQTGFPLYRACGMQAQKTKPATLTGLEKYLTSFCNWSLDF